MTKSLSASTSRRQLDDLFTKFIGGDPDPEKRAELARYVDRRLGCQPSARAAVRHAFDTCGATALFMMASMKTTRGSWVLVLGLMACGQEGAIEDIGELQSALVTAPSIATPSAGDSVDEARPQFLGRCTSGNNIVVKEGATTLCSRACANTLWNCTPGFDLTEGSHTVIATASDGSSSASSSSRTFVVDTVLPAMPTMTFNTPTNDSTPTFSGTKEANTRIRVFVIETGVTLCTVSLSAATTWSCTATTPLLDGTHTVMAVARDAAGNEAVSGSRLITIDTETPLMPIMTFTTPTNDSTPTFSGTKDPDTSMRVYVIETGTTLCTVALSAATTWSCTATTPLLDGTHTVMAVARDAAGNEAVSGSRLITVDTVHPANPAMLYPQPGDHVTNPFAFIGTREANTRVEVWGNYGGQFLPFCAAPMSSSTTWNCQAPAPLAAGLYQLIAVAIDAANNAAQTTTVTVTVD